MTKTVLITDISLIETYLILTAGGGSPDNPINLTLGIELSPMTANNSGWRKLLTSIQRADKYVNLDLSACTLGSAFMPEFNPDPNIKIGKDKIVSLILPNAAANISDNYFNLFTNLKTVSGAKKITVQIGHGTFAGCTALVSADFPCAASVGDQAFTGCTALKSVSFPLVTSIGSYSFCGCTSLENVSLPQITSIGDYAFSGCTGLKNVSFPQAISIHYYAFSGCTSLESASLPQITSIGDYAFSGCTYLKKVSFPQATSIYYYAFSGCTALMSAEFPQVTHIYGSAFSGCTGLENMSFPQVTFIGFQAFTSTGSVTLSIELGPGAPTLSGEAFAGVCAKTVIVKVPPGAADYMNRETMPITYSGNDQTECWGNGFRGGGWNEKTLASASSINNDITLHIVTEKLDR